MLREEVLDHFGLAVLQEGIFDGLSRIEERALGPLIVPLIRRVLPTPLMPDHEPRLDHTAAASVPRIELEAEHLDQNAALREPP